jgi:hypothetical protein
MRTPHRSRARTLAALAAGALLLSVAAGTRAADDSAGAAPEGSGRPGDAAPRNEAQADPASGPQAEPASGPQASAAVLYVPPEIGVPGRRIGAGTRGMGRVASLQILAPDHLGFTTEEQPTLYWYLAEPTTTRIEFTIRDETSVEPLAELELPTNTRAGIQAVRLADHGVRLRVGTRYRWYVSLVPEPARRSKDFTVGAWIARREPDTELRRRLAAAGGRDAWAYAESGLFYDALDVLSSQIAEAPGDRTLREQRAGLLEQAGLSEVAAYDQGVVSPP